MIPKNNEIRFEPTTACNYKCVFCRSPELKRPVDTMKMPLFSSLLSRIQSETQQYDTMTWAGIGEPLLNPHIEEMTRYATKRGMRVLVVTNGSLLTRDRFKSLQDAGVYSVRVSFHGATRDGYARLHGRDMFDETLANVYAASAERTTCKLLLTWAQVEGVNEDATQTWIDLFDRRVDLMEIWRAHNWAGAFKFRKEQDVKLRTCGRPDRGPLQVQVDGKLTVCCFDYDGQLEFGDLKSQTLATAFDSPQFRAIKERHDSGNYCGSGLVCEHCDQRNADKSDVLIYTSANVAPEKRVLMTSTAYTQTTKREEDTNAKKV